MLRLALLLGALLVAAVLAAAVPASALAAPNQVTTFEAPGELLDDRQRDRTLDEIRAFGVTHVRALVIWQYFAPAPEASRRPRFDPRDPESYGPENWGRLDRLFASAQARGMTVQLTLTGPVPRWATRARRDRVTDPDPEAFEAFAEAVGRRYGPQVATWSIWNEPNHPDFLRPQYRQGQPVSPRLYRKLFLAGRRGLERSGNGEDTLLFGETAPAGNANLVAPVAFLRGTLCLDERYRRARGCGRLEADGYAHHAYTKRSGPSYRPEDADDVTIGVLSRLTGALDRAARAGALPRGLGLHLTEFGIQSVPDRTIGVSLAQQAEFLAIAERLAYSNPRVRSFSQYLLRDDRELERFQTGLRTATGVLKPAYAAFRLPLTATDYGRSAVLWGRVRPAGTRTTVTLQARRGRAWRTVDTVATNSFGVFGARVAHRKGQRYRVRWAAPDGTRYTGATVRAY